MTSVAARAFRDCVGEFATGVTVVTTESEHGPAGMTLNSFTSVSLDPLLILVCVDRAARLHDAMISAGPWGETRRRRSPAAIARAVLVTARIDRVSMSAANSPAITASVVAISPATSSRPRSCCPTWTRSGRGTR